MNGPVRVDFIVILPNVRRTMGSRVMESMRKNAGLLNHGLLRFFSILASLFHSLAPHCLLHSLAPHCLLRSRAPLRSFVRSLAHSHSPELMGKWFFSME